MYNILDDDDAEADSFIGQSTASDQFKPQQFSYFSQKAQSDFVDPFSQVRQPELQPVTHPSLLSKPSPLPQFNLAATQQASFAPAVGATSVNPYAAGAAIASARPPGHYLSSGTSLMS